MTPMVSREVEITIDKLLAMIDTKRVATRYAQNTVYGAIAQTEEIPEIDILKELEFEDDECEDSEIDLDKLFANL